MSNTKLRAKLPEGDANGLAGDAWRKRLVERPRKPRVAIVIFDVDSITTTLDTNEEVPAVRLLAVEPVEDAIEQSVLIDQLQRSQAARTGRTTLDGVDFPAPEPAEDLWTPAEIAAATRPHFEVRGLPAGRFGLYLVSETGAVLAKRGGLTTREYGDVALGATFFADDAPSEFQKLVEVLLAEYEPRPEDVVDAEVVEDEPEPPTDAEWDDDGSDFEGGDR